MAGGRSFGCRTCKNRRIKCDERKPVCWQCEKSRRVCHGPESPFRYEYVSLQVRCGAMAVNHTKQQSENKDNCQQTLLVQGKPPSAAMQISDRHDALSFQSQPTQHSVGYTMGSTYSSLTKSISLSDAETLSNAVIASLDRTVFGFRLHWLGICFHMLPCRIGKNTALDAAVGGLLCSLSRLRQSEAVAEEQILRCYGKALKDLRLQLNGSELVPSSETLCAALIVSWIEILQQWSEDSYIRLSGGVSALFQARGPENINSDFELALFESHLGSLVINPLLCNTDCFLDTNAWREVICRCPNLVKSGNAAVYIAMAALPPLVRQVRQMVATCNSSPDNLHDLISHIQAIRSTILTHGPTSGKHAVCFSKMFPVQFSDTNTTRDNGLEIQHYEMLKRYILSWTAIIIINRLLQRLTVYDETLGIQIESAAAWIMNLIPISQAIKPLGCLFMCISGPVAYGVVPRAKQLLIHEAMNQLFAEIHMTFSCEVLQVVSDLVTGGPI